jgi:hypothetical protein
VLLAKPRQLGDAHQEVHALGVADQNINIDNNNNNNNNSSSNTANDNNNGNNIVKRTDTESESE